MGRKSWQFASKLPGEKLSQIHNPGDNSLLVDHAYNPIHRRYEYDPAGELTRTLDKLRGEIKYEYEANGQLHSRDTGKLVDSEEFRYDAAANRLRLQVTRHPCVGELTVSALGITLSPEGKDRTETARSLWDYRPSEKVIEYASFCWLPKAEPVTTLHG
ncbi:YD repeat-containing protein [Pseudomonas sp. LP_7_YM]|nr:YD repeat-containing protein [Pseudomonas sp. LP_7_YM]